MTAGLNAAQDADAAFALLTGEVAAWLERAEV